MTSPAATAAVRAAAPPLLPLCRPSRCCARSEHSILRWGPAIAARSRRCSVRSISAAYVRRIIERAGARVLYLPPYSPDLNPIELCWSKLKAALRDFGARTRDALDAAIKRAMDLIGADDAAAWFSHCGYEAPGN